MTIGFPIRGHPNAPLSVEVRKYRFWTMKFVGQITRTTSAAKLFFCYEIHHGYLRRCAVLHSGSK